MPAIINNVSPDSKLLIFPNKSVPVFNIPYPILINYYGA